VWDASATSAEEIVEQLEMSVEHVVEGATDAAIVTELATKPQFAFVAARGVDTGAAISEFITSLTQSVISSGQAIASGAAQLQFEKPEGFTLAVDVV
jgi:hypothetical protein